MAAIRIIDDHLELASIGSNTHAQIDTHIAAADNYVKRDGSLTLTSDWDIGDTRKILADEIRARDAAGLKLYDDGGNGLRIGDGGLLEIWNPSGYSLKIYTNSILRTQIDQLGKQSWFLNSGAAECGRIEYSTPGGTPGIVFWNTSYLGRSQMRQLSSTGGFSFGATSGSGNPGDQVVISNTGKLGVKTTSPTAYVDINSDILRLRTSKTPATAGAAGNQGDFCWDANFLYVCTATNSWERAAIAAW